jgi:hypothetical protein
MKKVITLSFLLSPILLVLAAGLVGFKQNLFGFMLDLFPSSFVISSLHSSLCASKMPWMRKKSLRSNPKNFHLKPTRIWNSSTDPAIHRLNIIAPIEKNITLGIIKFVYLFCLRYLIKLAALSREGTQIPT